MCGSIGRRAASLLRLLHLLHKKSSLRVPQQQQTLSLVLILAFVAPVALAQGDAPLNGPLLAATTAEQDAILLYGITSGVRREISFGPGLHHIWDFSPDGCRVLFTLSDGPALGKLYSARLDGGDLRPLVQYDELPPASWGIWEPDWSPDGSRIAFRMTRDLPAVGGEIDRAQHIAWIPADGGEPTFYSVTGDEHNPAWSPDGNWLAYISFDERAPGTDIFATAEPTVEPLPGQPTPEITLLREADLWVVSADAETKYRLTTFPTGSVRAPRWSPDSDLIGFTYAPSPNNDTLWMIGNAPGAIATQLSFQYHLALELTWLPDSTAMLGALRDFRGATENRLWQIPLVGNADEGGRLYVDDPSLSHADYPRFSADGRWLALRSAYNLAVVDTLTATWGLLDADVLANTAPVWSPLDFAGEAACNA